jgi:steroid 5-alpha reductase family enzyme
MVEVQQIVETLFMQLDTWFPAYCAWVLLTITFFIAQRIDDYSIIDFAWGMGFVVQ